MSIAFFFVTHEGIASNLLRTAEAITQSPDSNLSFIEIPMGSNVDEITSNAEKKLQQLDISDGVFFFTDIYGSTPSNIADKLAIKHKAPLISGISLPMIIRLLNYREESRQSILQKALDGAHHGIQLIHPGSH